MFALESAEFERDEKKENTLEEATGFLSAFNSHWNKISRSRIKFAPRKRSRGKRLSITKAIYRLYEIENTNYNSKAVFSLPRNVSFHPSRRQLSKVAS